MDAERLEQHPPFISASSVSNPWLFFLLLCLSVAFQKSCHNNKLLRICYIENVTSLFRNLLCLVFPPQTDPVFVREIPTHYLRRLTCYYNKRHSKSAAVLPNGKSWPIMSRVRSILCVANIGSASVMPLGACCRCPQALTWPGAR